jgi:hypothetical protein
MYSRIGLAIMGYKHDCLLGLSTERQFNAKKDARTRQRRLG